MCFHQQKKECVIHVVNPMPQAKGHRLILLLHTIPMDPYGICPWQADYHITHQPFEIASFLMHRSWEIGRRKSPPDFVTQNGLSFEYLNVSTPFDIVWGIHILTHIVPVPSTDVCQNYGFINPMNNGIGFVPTRGLSNTPAYGHLLM